MEARSRVGRLLRGEDAPVIRFVGFLILDLAHFLFGTRTVIKLTLMLLDRGGDAGGYMRVRAAWHEHSGEWLHR